MKTTFEYTSTARRVGKKIRYEVLRDGLPFADRTTGRVYTVAMLVKDSRAYSIANAEANIAYYKKTLGGWTPEERAERIKQQEAKLASIPTDPKFDSVYVLSWHSSQATARVPKHVELIGFVNLVQPVE